MAFEIEPFPEFSWSQSRRSTFRECPRRYFWQYYGSHNGWLAESPEEVHLAWRLKKITNLHMALGSVVHEIAAHAVQRARGGGAAPTPAQLVEEGRAQLNRIWVQSQRREEWERAPNRIPMLMEFYRATGPGRDLIERIRDRLYACLRNLPSAESFREAIEAPQVEVKEIDRLDFVEIEGVKVYAQPDLLYRVGDAWRIVDWKTGARGEGHAPQLRTYAVYLRERKDLPRGPVIGRLEYLESGDALTVPITDRDIADERGRILASVDNMREYLANPARNEPKLREAFPLTEDTRQCPRCNFYELCEDELAMRGETGPF